MLIKKVYSYDNDVPIAMIHILQVLLESYVTIEILIII